MSMRTKRTAALSLAALISATASAASITGSATYRERMALPPDAASSIAEQDR